MRPRVRPVDVAEGNRSLEYALQAMLNVQALDRKIFAQSMLSPQDRSGGTLDAQDLLQRLQEVGPNLVDAEDRLYEQVQGLSLEDAVAVLRDIGLDADAAQKALEEAQDLDVLLSEIFEAVKEALPADTMAEAVDVTAQRRIQGFLERRGVTRHSQNIAALKHDSEPWGAVWARMQQQYSSGCPSRALHSARGASRASLRVMVIGPGFGMLATPTVIGLVREARYQLMELTELPNLEDVQNPIQVQQALQLLLARVGSFKPNVICAASKGGLYFPLLWQDPNWSIACVMINAHPSITRLPRNAAVVVTQGSRDDTFNRITERQPVVLENEQVRTLLASNTRFGPVRCQGDPPALVVQQELNIPLRVATGQVHMQTVPAGAVLLPQATIHTGAHERAQGYAAVNTIEELMNLTVPASISYRHGREELEALLDTGDQQKSLLYLSCTGMTVRPGMPIAFTRFGDGHAAPESLLRQDCLPRLIDAAASGKPEDAFHQSWADLVPEDRLAAEAILGYDPQGLCRFWSGNGLNGVGARHAVEADSDEWCAVEAIFRSNPDDKSYQFNIDWTGKRVLGVDRIESDGQLKATDAYYETVKSSLQQQGTAFVNGVHTRWLWHGSPAIESILADPVEGFKVTLSRATMWGKGVYFARDAQYPDDHGFCGDAAADGSKEMLLCLCVTGMSTLGDECYGIAPYRNGTKHRYNSFVDTLSNPEIMVVSSAAAALPAYVVRYTG